MNASSQKLYELLGVDAGASDKDVKSAYRKLAKELHPDLNPGDSAAEERFKEISAAFAILGDSEKRGQYDRGEIDESGAERPPQNFYRGHADTDQPHQYHSSAGYHDFEDLSDLFGEALRQSRQREGQQANFKIRGADVRYHLQVGFLEAVNGASRRVEMPDGATLDISIPAGVEEGQSLRLKGKGQPGYNGGPPGDAYVSISISPHAQFKREGRNIVIEVPITCDEAVLGGKIEVPTPDGRVKISVPKGSSSGRTLRLKGKGVKGRRGAPVGDALVRLKIVLPEVIDPALVELMEKWRDDHSYNPREELEAAS